MTTEEVLVHYATEVLELRERVKEVERLRAHLEEELNRYKGYFSDCWEAADMIEGHPGNLRHVIERLQKASNQ